MATESNENQQIPEGQKTRISAKQQQVILSIITGSTYTSAAKKANVNRGTLYKWIADPNFSAELDRQQELIAEAGYRTLLQNVESAADKLVALLKHKNAKLRRLVCNDVIGHALRHREMEDLERRMIAIEQRLAEIRRH